MKKKSQFMLVLHRMRRNKLAIWGFCIIVFLLILFIFAEQLAPYSYEVQDYNYIRTPPGKTLDHILGTDHLGRDVLSRLIYGSRYSLKVGFASVLLAAFIGLIFGAVAGYCGGKVDHFLMRFLDIYQSIPIIIMAMALTTVFGSGMNSTILAIGVSSMGGYARQMRASVMQLSDMEFIEAERAINAKSLRILLKHIFPNSLSPIIVQLSMSIGGNILIGASLSFLGLGAQPPIPEWGAMLAESRKYIRDSSYLLYLPGLMIFLSVMAFNLLGDGLRDAMDPKLKN